MLKYYVGCSGWQHSIWKGKFYPYTIDSRDYLSYYSKVFDFVEVDLDRGRSYNSKNDGYYLPNKNIIKKWSENTHNDFRFTFKLPTLLSNTIDKLGNFLEELAPLEEKILTIVIHQTELSLGDGREWLEEILDVCTYHGYSVALEFDHFSWFQDLTYHILKRHNAALVWSDKYYYRYHPIVTGDFLYLRIKGNEKKWIYKITEKMDKENKGELDFAIIVLDEPSKVNTVLKLLGFPERKYGFAKWIGKVIMCIDLNAFFPSCEELRDPSLTGKPHAVIMTEQEKGKITKGAVASCSYEARKYGVRSAMSLLKAKEQCPELILNPVDIPYYRQISDNVMRILEEYADVLEQSSIDEAYLDCTNKISSSDPSITIEKYTEQIKKSIKEQCGLLTSIGVATTKSAAKIASDYQKPDGLTVIYPDKLQSFLEPLEVERISGIGIKTQQALKKDFGIETIGQLAKCDVQKLIDRFGKKNGLWMWQVANGQDIDDAVIRREDSISISSEQTLYRHTKDKEKILKYLNELVDEVYEE